MQRDVSRITADGQFLNWDILHAKLAALLKDLTYSGTCCSTLSPGLDVIFPVVLPSE